VLRAAVRQTPPGVVHRHNAGMARGAGLPGDCLTG
jgi:hypothetical protein